MKKNEELSKEVSYALRHVPWEYELEMDEEGWVSVEQLVDALNKDMKWIGTSEDDLLVMSVIKQLNELSFLQRKQK